MESLTWSSGLHSAIKKFKNMDSSKTISHFSYSKLLNSLSLSPLEESAVIQVFANHNEDIKSNNITYGYWA
jgi:hypothetical protein